MRRRLHLVVLRVFGRLPQRVQTFIVHRVSPSYSAGSLVVVVDAGRVLLVSHPYKAGWGLPGGITKRGEASDETAHRELREEVGLAVVLCQPALAAADPVERKVDVLYAARLAAGVVAADAQPMTPEITECRWFPLADLPLVQKIVPMAISRLQAVGLVPVA